MTARNLHVNVRASDLVAIIAIPATVAVAWIGHRDRVADRDHTMRLARESRVDEHRGSAYRDMLLMTLKIQDIVRQTMPMFERDPAPQRIDAPSADEQRAVAASVGLYGTPRVLELLNDTRAAANDFFLAAEYLGDVRLIAQRRPEGGDELRNAREGVDNKRSAFVLSVQQLEAAARDNIGR